MSRNKNEAPFRERSWCPSCKAMTPTLVIDKRNRQDIKIIRRRRVCRRCNTRFSTYEFGIIDGESVYFEPAGNRIVIAPSCHFYYGKIAAKKSCVH